MTNKFRLRYGHKVDTWRWAGDGGLYHPAPTVSAHAAPAHPAFSARRGAFPPRAAVLTWSRHGVPCRG